MPPVKLERQNIAAEGDLIVVVSNQLELRVQSQFLTMLSPAFRGMLDPQWLEAQSLLFINAAHPGRLSLPDDDAEAAKLLFLVLHNQNDRLPSLPEPKSLLELAKLAQKYRCLPVTKIAFALWFTKIRSSKTQYEHLAAAYIVDDPIFFGRFSRAIVRDFDSDQIRETCKKVIDAGDEFGLGAIIQSRHQVLRKLLAGGITYMVEEMCKLTCSQYDHSVSENPATAAPTPHLSPCRYYRDAVSYHLRLLSDDRIWPEACRTESLATIGDCLDARQSAASSLSGYHGTRTCCEAHDDNWFKWHYEPSIEILNGFAISMNIKMCLDCLKSPTGEYDGICRIEVEPFDHKLKIIPRAPADAPLEIRNYLVQMRQEFGDI